MAVRKMADRKMADFQAMFLFFCLPFFCPPFSCPLDNLKTASGRFYVKAQFHSQHSHFAYRVPFSSSSNRGDEGRNSDRLRPHHIEMIGSLMEGGKRIGGMGSFGIQTDAGGEFHLPGILPGKYSAFGSSDQGSDFYSEPTL
jgi:hypothetical protein